MLLSQAITKFMRDYFSRRELSAETQTAYSSDLAQFLSFAGAGAPLNATDRNLVERWASRLRREGYSPATVRRRLMALRAFCTYWARAGALAESPFWRMEPSGRAASPPPRTLTAEELLALVERAREELCGAPALSGRRPSPFEPGFRSLRDLALVELMIATGMRVSEVSALDVISFNTDKGSFTIAWSLRSSEPLTGSDVLLDPLGREACERGLLRSDGPKVLLASIPVLDGTRRVVGALAVLVEDNEHNGIAPDICLLIGRMLSKWAVALPIENAA